MSFTASLLHELKFCDTEICLLFTYSKYLVTFQNPVNKRQKILVNAKRTLELVNITDILPDPSKIYDFKDLQSFFLATTLSTFQATTRPTNNVQFVLNQYYKK